MDTGWIPTQQYGGYTHTVYVVYSLYTFKQRALQEEGEEGEGEGEGEGEEGEGEEGEGEVKEKGEKEGEEETTQVRGVASSSFFSDLKSSIPKIPD